MARLVKSGIDYVYAFVIDTIMEDGSVSEAEYKIGELMTNLRYIENKEIKSVTGKLSKINYNNLQVTRNFGTPATLRSHFADDVLPVSIEVDCSEQYASKVIEIPCHEIIEDEGVTGVKRMKCHMKYGARFTSELTDGSTNDFTIWEGQDIQGLVYMDRGGDVKVDVRVVTFTYDAVLTPLTMVVIENGVTKNLDIICIKDMGAVVPATTPDVEDLQEAFEAKEDEEGNKQPVYVALTAGEFTTPVELKADTTIRGAWAGINGIVRAQANALTREGAAETFEGETVFNGTITIPDGTSLVLDGLTLSADAKIATKNAASLELRNCIIKDLNVSKDTFIVHTKFNTAVAEDNVVPTKLVIRACYFGNNIVTGTDKVKNGLELTGPLADGSGVIGCYFEKDVAANNIVCLYNIADNAKVTVRDNFFEFSGNGIRVGTIGEPKNVQVDIINNTYDSTCEGSIANYAGLLLIQPYAAKTVSMAGVTIRMVDNVNNTDMKQLYYMYYGEKDTQMKPEIYPTLIVDGDVVMAPVEA